MEWWSIGVMIKKTEVSSKNKKLSVEERSKKRQERSIKREIAKPFQDLIAWQKAH